MQGEVPLEGEGGGPLHRYARAAERALDTLRTLGARLGGREGGQGHAEVVPFIGHGTVEELRVGGRVLRKGGRIRGRPGSTVVRNLRNAWRRLESDEAPHRDLVVEVAGQRIRTRSDEEGYFDVRVRPGPGTVPVEGGWMEGRIRLGESGAATEPEEAERASQGAERALVRVPGTSARFGVVSDLDDTVIRTGATSLLTMARLTLLENAFTRLPFEGVAAFYRALERGTAHREHNPFFYVSSSPWNLFDLLADFLAFRGVPAGPLFLRDLGLGPSGFVGFGGHHAHKLGRIEEVFELHENLPFVLVGDSGQKDPEIYREVVLRHPDRIRAVYIRDVTGEGRGREVETVVRDVVSRGVDMVVIPDSVAAAEHAEAVGLVDRHAVREVRADADTAVHERLRRPPGRD